ncbi:MAG TPA: hypothetical protein ENH91_09235 [Leeuwenhoekiella sp.]|nr:hypothetical protein [Leeuwenhoekiella sp.]
MSIFCRLFRFYINSSIHVALAVCAFTAITINQLHLHYADDLLFFIFFGTITGYNFVKYAGIAQLHHRSLTSGLKMIQIFSLFCFVCSLYYAFQVSWDVLLACIPLGLLTLFYAVPLFPSNDNLRTTPTLKVFVIAAVWAGTTVYLPKVAFELQWETEIIILLIQRFLIVLALIIPFEIRDLTFDDKKLATLPQLLGIKSTKMLGYLLLFFALGINFMSNSGDNWLFSEILISLTALAIYFSGKKQNPYYASFWVEGIPICCWLGQLFI